MNTLGCCEMFCCSHRTIVNSVFSYFGSLLKHLAISCIFLKTVVCLLAASTFVFNSKEVSALLCNFSLQLQTYTMPSCTNLYDYNMLNKKGEF